MHNHGPSRQAIELELDVPVLLASGAHYATFRIHTKAEIAFRGGALSAEDDPRLCELALRPIELPSGECLMVRTAIPLGLFGRMSLVRQRAWPVVLPESRDSQPQPNIVINMPEQPPPVVHVPEQPAPVINLPEQPAPVVNVSNEISQSDRAVTFERDKQGKLTGAKVETVESV